MTDEPNSNLLEPNSNLLEPKRCELEETESYDACYVNHGNELEMMTVHILECSECGEECEHVNGTYERCPHCGAANVLDENYVDDSPISEKPVASLKESTEDTQVLTDSREQLEWDAKMLVDNLRFYGFEYADDPKQEIIELLDRQDAITSRELDGECEFCQSEVARLQNHVDALEAEVEAQRKRANDAERGVLSEEWYISRERYDDDIAELTAERDELKHANKRQAEKLTGVCDLNDVQSKRIKELEAERDQYRLNANIFADYAQRWRDEVEQLKRANRIQAESFRKMELDSKQACDALKAACRELLEVSGTCPYDSHSVQPRNCDEECKTDAAFMAGCWELYFRGDAS